MIYYYNTIYYEQRMNSIVNTKKELTISQKYKTLNANIINYSAILINLFTGIYITAAPS